MKDAPTNRETTDVLEIDPYAPISELYDLEHQEFAEDIDLYLNLAQMIGDPILEVGCGSGRILVPLAGEGFRLVGTDRSFAMLNRAQRNIDLAGLTGNVTLASGSMDEPPPTPHGPFGLAIVGLNGFLHLESSTVQRAALKVLHDALDPRGQLVVDVLNPTPDALHALEGVHLEGTWTRADGTRVYKHSAHKVTHTSQMIASEIWYDLVALDGHVRRISTSIGLRFVHLAELELMLELAGFVEWQVYGGYNLEPFDDSAERLIIAAEVTPS